MGKIRTPDGLTANQKDFAALVASGRVTQAAAYEQVMSCPNASKATIIANAKKTIAIPAVRAYVTSLQRGATAAAVRKLGITLADSIQLANDICDEARANGNQSAAVSAATLRSKLLGQITEKKEVRTGVLEDTDVAQLLEIKKEIAARAQREKDATAPAGAIAPPELEVEPGNRPVRTLQ